MRVTRRAGLTGLVLLAGLALGDLAPVRAADAKLAETVLGQVLRARALMKENCNFDILTENPLGEMTCKTGSKTSGEAWDEALNEAGLPTTERDGLADRLGLTPVEGDEKAGLWRADPKDVARLIGNLRLMASG